MTNCDACDPYYTAPMQELEQKEEGGHLVHTPLYMQWHGIELYLYGNLPSLFQEEPGDHEEDYVVACS